MTAPKLAVLLVAACSLFAGDDRDWQTGTVNRVTVVPYGVPGLELSDGLGNHAYPPPQILQRIQIEGDTYVFNVSYVVSWHTPKVTVDGPIKYALDQNGRFYIQDEDNREFKVTMVSKVLSPLPRVLSPRPSDSAGNDYGWKTGNLNWVGYVPMYTGWVKRPPQAKQWLQIEGDSYIYNATYIATRCTPKVTVNSPIKYARGDDGEFHILDEDNRDFKVTLVSKALLPPAAESETSTPPPPMTGYTSAPRTLFDRDGVEVIAVETEKTIDFTVDTPESVQVRILADRDQDGQIDRLVDTSYSLRRTPALRAIPD